MKITQPYLYGDKVNEFKIKVFIVDEKNNEDIEIQTYTVKSDFKTYQLRTNTNALTNIFYKVVKILTKDYGINVINSLTNSIELEMIADCEQHGNWLKLKFKLKN